MDILKATFFTALIIAIPVAPTASAQTTPATAAKVEVVSGNGQLICASCPLKRFNFFFPMVVKVSDASGNPIAGKTVNWQLVNAIGVLPSLDTVSVTDSHGLAASRITQGAFPGSFQQPFLQSVVSATADAASANFTETQALTDAFFGVQIVFSRIDAPSPGVALAGPAGSTGTSPIKVHVDGGGVPVPNVSLRILSPDIRNLPSASCATAAGADPGSVLTDTNGNATCFPVFGPVAGSGSVSALVGGLDPAEFDQTLTNQPLTAPISFDEYPGIQVVVSPVTPGLVSIVSGTNQSIDPGKTSAPLVVKVTDATGAVPIGNATVAWTVSPVGAATLSATSTTTNAQGQAQTSVIFAANATGQITVKATLASGNSAILPANFTLLTNIQIASVTKVSGDLQSTQAGQNFGAPLIVQVNGTNLQPVSNLAVSFAVNSGTATLSATSALTDATGRAQTTVTAGATPGTVTVTAFVTGNISQTFTLTIIPPGPAISASTFFNTGGAARIAALSPCSLVTVIAAGLATNVQGLVLNTNAFGPWATTLASDTVTVGGIAAPIYSVGNVNGTEQVTFQVPCEVAPAASVPITVNVGGGVGTVSFPVQAAGPGIFETVMSDGARRAVVIRPDGTFVSLLNPARRNEVVRVLVTGLGAAIPAVPTGALPVPGSDALIDVTRLIVGVNNGGTRVVSARVSPNLIGVAEVAFQVPSDALTGNDVVLSVAINAPGDSQTRFSNGSKLPIQ